MPSTYTANVAFEKPADGEQTGSWGDTVNDNSDIIDRLTSQVGVISLLGSTYTLTTSTSGALSEGHYSLVRFTGTPGATCTVTINPNTIQRIYTVYNDTNQTVIMAPTQIHMGVQLFAPGWRTFLQRRIDPRHRLAPLPWRLVGRCCYKIACCVAAWGH